MKLFSLVLVCLFYSAEAQFGLLNKGLNAAKGVSNAVPKVPGVPNLDQLEKLFLKDWLDYGKKFNKNYNPVEAPLRKANFLQNINTITKLATDSVLGFGLKINEFADMLFDEFNERFNGFNRNKKLQSHLQSSKADTFVAAPEDPLPESVDWREKGAVSPVKNQQSCAGCWAFAVAGCVEGQNARKTGNLVEASVQHLIDCATGKYDNDGCRGGLTETGFDYVEDNGINTYSDYPYEALNTTCRSKENTIVKTKGYVRIPEGDEKALAQALAKFGPISAAIHVTDNFQFYGSKVFDDPLCGNTVDHLNHAVLIVGYGKEADGKKYWLVKNSYGPTWGLDGFFKMAKDEGNKCGIATYARYPNV